MPAYNAEKSISASIDSVLNQTQEDFELIIIDDASSDRTSQIVQEYAERDDRVELIRLRANRGVANARNIGTKAAKGDFVAFLDADDLWRPTKLQSQMSFMLSAGASFSYTNYIVINNNGTVIGKRITKEDSLDHRQLLRGNRIGLLTVMLNRSMALAHPFPEIHHEDYACWLSILREGVVAQRAGTAELADYRKHATSLSANKFEAAKWTWAIYRSFEGMSVFKSLFYFIHYVFMAVSGQR